MTDGALLLCAKGTVPATLTVLPTARVSVEGKAHATVGDMKPFVNIKPFGLCTSLANPTVATATSAALGVLTPMPCVPAPLGAWAPGAPRTLVGGLPALVAGSKCMCMWGGVISIANPTTVQTTEA